MKLKHNGRITGDLVNGRLIKKGKQVVKFYMHNGFGIPAALLNDSAIKEVEIHYEGKVYRASTIEFEMNGIPEHRPPYEEQLILPIRYFTPMEEKQVSLF